METLLTCDYVFLSDKEDNNLLYRSYKNLIEITDFYKILASIKEDDIIGSVKEGAKELLNRKQPVVDVYEDHSLIESRSEWEEIKDKTFKFIDKSSSLSIIAGPYAFDGKDKFTKISYLSRARGYENQETGEEDNLNDITLHLSSSAENPLIIKCEVDDNYKLSDKPIEGVDKSIKRNKELGNLECKYVFTKGGDLKKLIEELWSIPLEIE